MDDCDEDLELRSVAMQNAQSILLARQRAEAELIRANETLERRTAELAHSLSVMRATFDSTWDGILVTADDGGVTGYNQQFIGMWRIPGDRMAFADHASFAAYASEQSADAHRFIARLDEIYATALAESYDMLELRDARVFERFSKTLVVNDRQAGRVWTFRDITDRRIAENTLRDETQMLELLNRTGISIAATLDLRVLVQSITDAATHLSGARFGAFFFNAPDAERGGFELYTLSGAPREAFAQFDRPRATGLFGPILSGRGPIRCDDVVLDPRYGQLGPHHGMPPGHLPVRSFLGLSVISRSGEVIGGLFFGHPECGVFTERTERLVSGVAAQAAVAIDNARLYTIAQRAAEERRHLLDSERSARAHAERMSEVKDEFLATLSHELRTPLSAILGWSHILRHSARSAQDLQNGLEAIERNARVQAKLIEDLLDMSRIASGKVRLDVQPLQPISFIEAAIETVRPAADAKSITVTTRLDPHAGPISGDPSRLQQVAWNLLSNAIKFTPKDGGVEVQLQRIDSHVEIRVTDTGIGIDAEFVAHVFDRFRQADHSSTRRYGGLGLGLAIVKHLVELHGGTVSVASDGEGRGATFAVRLPVTAVQRQSAGLPRLAAVDAAVLALDYQPLDLTGVTVLIVDDEADTRLVLERILSACGAEVLLAGNADTALRLIASDRLDVLVSDIGMPDMDGYELLRRVRAASPAGSDALPAIALSAFARAEDRVRALHAGFQVHVSKPVEPSELIATVAALARRGTRRD